MNEKQVEKKVSHVIFNIKVTTLEKRTEDNVWISSGDVLCIMLLNFCVFNSVEFAFPAIHKWKTIPSPFNSKSTEERDLEG